MRAGSIEEIARAELASYDGCTAIEPPSSRAPAFDIGAGYQVLAEVLRLRRARGERTAGRKIGFTNRNIWAQYGVDSPIWAPVYETTLVAHAGGTMDFSLRQMYAPRIEPEIAFGLCAPLSAGVRDPGRVLERIEWVAPAFEIVDCRYADWTFRVQDSVAQQGLHAALILGPRVALAPAARARWASQLADCAVVLECDRVLAERGVGANALGHPAAALAFLADVLAGQPQFSPISAGEIVTTGTLTPALPIAPGETWRYTLAGIDLPPLAVRFEK